MSFSISYLLNVTLEDGIISRNICQIVQWFLFSILQHNQDIRIILIFTQSINTPKLLTIVFHTLRCHNASSLFDFVSKVYHFIPLLHLVV